MRLAWCKLQTQRINTIALISRRIKAFAFKYMPQMSTALCTCHLCTNHAMAVVSRKHHRPRHCIIKTWPTAPRIKFLLTRKQLAPTCCAGVRPRVKYTIILTAKWCFGRLFAQYLVLLGRQLLFPLCIILHTIYYTPSALCLIGHSRIIIDSMKRFLLLPLVLLMTVGILSPAAHAKDETQITMSPISEELSLEPNNRYEKTLVIYNSGTRSLTFSLYARPYTVANERYVPLFDGDAPQQQLRRWISFPEVVYHLDPGKQVSAPYVITTPASLPDGGQYATIFAETTGEKNDDNLITKKRVGMIIYAHAKGKTTYKGSSTSSTPQRITPTASYTMQARITNTGNVDFKATSTLTVNDYFSKKQLYSYSLTKPVLPATTRLVELPWQDDNSLFHMYRVTQTVAYLKQTDTTQSVMIVMSPLLIFVVLLALLTLILIATWCIIILRNHYRHKKHAGSTQPDVSSANKKV